MTTTSGGSRVDPKLFLTSYANQIEEDIRDLQRARQLDPGDAALRGVVGQTIKDRVGTSIIM